MPSEANTLEIEEPLLGCLRQALDDPGLDYCSAPYQILGGNENDIFSFRLKAAAPFDQPLILRLFRADATPDRARKEAAVHRAVTTQGLAAPRVLLVGDEHNCDGRSFLIMEHVAGRSALGLLHPSLLLRLPSLHAETMIALHRLDAGVFLNSAEAAGLDRLSVTLNLDRQTAERKAARDFPSLERLDAWLEQNRPDDGPPVIAHGDLHPFNLMIDNGRVSAVLDWTRAVIAPREYDIAANRVIVRYGPVVGNAPLRTLLPLMRRWVLGRFEAIYRAELPIDEPLVRYFEVRQAFDVLTNVALLRRAKASDSEALPERDKESGAFDGPNLRGMLARVEQISGIRVELPPVAPTNTGS